MMKTIVEINSINYASTGNIMLNIAKTARENGYRVFTCCKASKESFKYHFEDQIIIGNRYERIISDKLAYFTGLREEFNIVGTYLFLKKLDKIKPDIIHIHTLHYNYININMLFNYIKKHKIKTVWTLHDSYAFTGKCVNANYIKCFKWKDACGSCPLLHDVPNTFAFDTTKYILKRNKALFESINDLTIVTPSIWLSTWVKESILKNHEVLVLHNGIDLKTYAPTENDFRKIHKLENKFVVLSVANGWDAADGKAKGLDTIIELSKSLDEKYQFVVVGTNDAIDAMLPKNIISIHRTFNKQELINLYSTSDLFLNPTRNDNFPTVNVEALACGTPVLTANVGGSPEALDATCGSIIQDYSVEDFRKEIIRICETKPYSKENCLRRAKQFDMNDRYKDYIKLFNEILNK